MLQNLAFCVVINQLFNIFTTLLQRDIKINTTSL